MQFLGISGSLRAASGNTALLRGLAGAAELPITVQVYDGIGRLPAFTPDLEGALTPARVLDWAAAVGDADGLVVACPEYVHALPGAFKNAVDWLVSRPELVGKPIALIHASHRGEDVLTDLRRVLGTVSDRFAPDIFARFNLMKLTPDQIAATLREPDAQSRLRDFLARFAAFVAG